MAHTSHDHRLEQSWDGQDRHERERDDWDGDLAASVITAHAAGPGAMLPILHALQAAFGYVPKPSYALIAMALNVSRAEVHGVVSFYHDFRATPPGRHVLKLCRAEACQAMGAIKLAARLLRRENIAWGGTTADGALTIEATYCLGLCACAPAALLDGAPLARLDDAAIDALAAASRDRAMAPA